MSNGRKLNWAKIKKAYTQTDRPRMQIMEEFGLAASQLTARVKRDGWLRPGEDLSVIEMMNQRERTKPKVTVESARAFLFSHINEGHCIQAAKRLFYGPREGGIDILQCNPEEFDAWVHMNHELLLPLNRCRNHGEVNEYLSTTVGKWKFHPDWLKQGRVQSLDQD